MSVARIINRYTNVLFSYFTECVAGYRVAPVVLPEEEVRVKREKVPKIVNSAPTMLLEKPIVTDIDYYNVDLSWTPASLPPNSTPTSFTYVVASLNSSVGFGRNCSVGQRSERFLSLSKKIAIFSDFYFRFERMEELCFS